MKDTKPLDRVDGSSACRSCGEPIVWFITQSCKRMPVNASSVQPEDKVLDMKRHISHFATCPNATAHRRPR